MRQVITRGLKPEYSVFLTAIIGWPTKLSIVKLETLLANQEALAKQMAGILLKNEEDAIFTCKGKS